MLIVISSENKIENEVQIVTELFKAGLEIFHLRKPDWSLNQYEQLLSEFPENFINRIVIHHHISLIEKFQLKGIHLTSKNRESLTVNKMKKLIADTQHKGSIVSTSFHTVDEVKIFSDYKFDYAFLSPVFDSISKEKYKGHKMDLTQVKKPFPIIGLGGISNENIHLLKEKGYNGAAALGYIWQAKNQLDHFKLLQTT